MSGGADLPVNAGDSGLIPWSGGIPHTEEQLSPCTTTEPVLSNKRNHNEKPAYHYQEETPLAATLDKDPAQSKINK